MFQRFHEMRERGAKGFTLIELLVVILIIAILAAIAIPVFLNQRRKGWTAQQESAVKNMATAQESWLADPDNNAYTTDVLDLQAEGFTFSAADVTPSVVSATGTRYCLRSESGNDNTIVVFYDSDVGRPQTAACT